ncbi:MAG: DUF6118 family protein [Janthinobacterium lividum]
MVYRQVQQTGQPVVATGPDYTLTLGRMEKALGTIAGRLEAVEQQPALQMTTAKLAVELDAAARDAARTVIGSAHGLIGEMRNATQTLADLVGRVHHRREQRVWLWVVGGCSVLVECCCGSCWPHCCRGGGRLAGVAADRQRWAMGGWASAAGSCRPEVLGRDEAPLRGVRRAANEAVRTHRPVYRRLRDRHRQCLRPGYPMTSWWWFRLRKKAPRQCSSASVVGAPFGSPAVSCSRSATSRPIRQSRCRL